LKREKSEISQFTQENFSTPSFLFVIVSQKQARLEAGSTCAKNTGAEGAATVNRAPNAKGKGAKREMNTVKFWLEPALHKNIQFLYFGQETEGLFIVYYHSRQK
jgi:hypothetical protein